MNQSFFSRIKGLIKKFTQGSFRNAFTYGTASAITQMLMMVYLLLIANWLGPAEYGYIAAAYAAASLSSFIFNWGLNEWMMKVGSTADQPEALGGSVIILKTVFGVVWGVALWFGLRSVRPDLYLGNILLLTILDVWFDSIFGTLLVVFLLTDRVKHGSVLLILSRAARLILGLGLILFGPQSKSLVLILRTAGTVVMVIIAWAFAKPVMQISNPRNLWKLFKKSSAFNVSELLNLVYWYADVNILSLLGADSQLIGNYSIVSNLINAIIMLPLGMYNVLLPTLIRAYNEKKAAFLQQMKFIFIGFIALGLVLWGGAALLSQPVIIALLGEDYRTSVVFLVQLAPLLALRTLNQANIAYLITVGWQAKRILPQAIAVVGKIAVGLILVMNMGVNGMIIASIGSEGLLAGGYLLQILRHRKLPAEKVTSK